MIALLLVLLLVTTPTHAQLSRVDGTAVSSSGTPTLGACGTGPSLLAGSTDSWGGVTVGSGVVTSCVLNFSKTLSASPICIADDNSATISTGVTALSTSSVTFGFSASLGGGVVYYHCFGGS